MTDSSKTSVQHDFRLRLMAIDPSQHRLWNAMDENDLVSTYAWWVQKGKPEGEVYVYDHILRKYPPGIEPLDDDWKEAAAVEDVCVAPSEEDREWKVILAIPDTTTGQQAKKKFEVDDEEDEPGTARPVKKLKTEK